MSAVALGAMIIALPMVSGLGCTYARTTPLKRLGGDDYAASSNGDTRRHGQVRPFRGIPAVLEVPTHYAVTVKETCYVYWGKDGTIHEVAFRSPGEPRLLDASVVPIFRKKLFSVDFARPAGGTLTSTLAFNDVSPELTAGHIKTINNTVQEQTINQITEALGENGIKKLFMRGGAEMPDASANTAAARFPHTIKVEKTVAYALFDVDAPGVADQITGFLHHHISACHNCDGGVPCESGFMEEVPAPRSSAKVQDSGVEQVAFTEPARDGDGSIVEVENTAATDKGLRAVLREKESPYLTTDSFTLYEVEVVYE